MHEFISSSGRRLTRLPGYKELHPQKLAEEHDSRFLGTEAPAIYYQFIKDAFEYGLMMDQLATVGVYGPWKNALDIGGAEGTVSRLLKTEALASSVSCVDIKDFSRTLPDFLYWKFFLRFLVQSRFHRRRFRTSRLLNNFPQHFGYFPRRCDRFWNLSMRGDGRIDKYLTADVYDIEGPYDFVSALLCLPYFDYRRLFSKVASIIPRGGIFYVLTDYWWWPNNSSGILADIPYACQRLTRDDLLSYFQQHHPDQLELAAQRSGYFNQGHPPPVLDELVREASKCGFQVYSAQRLMPSQPDNERTFLTPDQIEAAAPGTLSDVLADISEIRNDVGLVDLKTAFVSLVLKRT